MTGNIGNPRVIILSEFTIDNVIRGYGGWIHVLNKESIALKPGIEYTINFNGGSISIMDNKENLLKIISLTPSQYEYLEKYLGGSLSLKIKVLVDKSTYLPNGFYIENLSNYSIKLRAGDKIYYI